MKPISWLRMRARSENERLATSFPLSQYLPSEGVSRRPRIDSRVVLPQPDGPAIETYSPFLISRWIPERAWVSTSSVRKTLVTPSRSIKVSGEFIGSSLVLQPSPSGSSNAGGRQSFSFFFFESQFSRILLCPSYAEVSERITTS